MPGSLRNLSRVTRNHDQLGTFVLFGPATMIGVVLLTSPAYQIAPVLLSLSSIMMAPPLTQIVAQTVNLTARVNLAVDPTVN